MSKRTEKGSAVASVLIATALLFVCCQIVGAVCAEALNRSKAQSAADAGALAGSLGGATAARAAVEANGAAIIESSGANGAWMMSAEYEGRKASARAHAR